LCICRYASKLHEIEEKLKAAELNDKSKDVEKYKKELAEIHKQVQIKIVITHSSPVLSPCRVKLSGVRQSNIIKWGTL
jgi:hypothetical protein